MSQIWNDYGTVIKVASCVAGVYLTLRTVRKAHRKLFAVGENRMMHVYNEKLRYHKQRLFAHLEEVRVKSGDGSAAPLRVLEIGAGCGANFEFYPANTSLSTVDPLEEARSYLLANAKLFESRVTLVNHTVCCAEDMRCVASASFDAVVCTLTLCSVSDVGAVLKEVKRVLRPGGAFICMEHVRARNILLWLMQFLLQPMWYLIGCGCWLLRSPHRDVRKAGFKDGFVQEFDAPISIPFIRPHVQCCVFNNS